MGTTPYKLWSETNDPYIKLAMKIAKERGRREKDLLNAYFLGTANVLCLYDLLNQLDEQRTQCERQAELATQHESLAFSGGLVLLVLALRGLLIAARRNAPAPTDGEECSNVIAASARS